MCTGTLVRTCATGVPLPLLHRVEVEYPRYDPNHNKDEPIVRPLAEQHKPITSAYVTYYHIDALHDIAGYVKDICLDFSYHIDTCIELPSWLSFPLLHSLKFSPRTNGEGRYHGSYSFIPLLLSSLCQKPTSPLSLTPSLSSLPAAVLSSFPWAYRL
jgi:hypothetical protein